MKYQTVKIIWEHYPWSMDDPSTEKYEESYYTNISIGYLIDDDGRYISLAQNRMIKDEGDPPLFSAVTRIPISMIRETVILYNYCK